MAGGNWVTQDGVIPGAFINFTTDTQESISLAEQGVATMPLVLKWGKVKEFVMIDMNTNFMMVFGYDILDSELILMKEALKRAKYLLVYRISSGLKASKTVDNLTATARFEGSRGNDITVVVEADPDSEGGFIIATYCGTKEVDRQSGTEIEDLKDNDFVVWSGTGALSENAGIKLEGGSNTAPNSGDYTDYFKACQLQKFNTIGLPVDDATIKGAAAEFTKRMIETEGKKIQTIVPSYTTADHEGIISVENGVILSDETEIDKIKAVAWTAGATAAANLNEDLAYTAYEDAVDVTERYESNKQIDDMLKAGKFFFVPKIINNKLKVVVQDDINTFTSLTKTKGREFHWNRSVRTMFDIGTTLPELWENRYIGKVDADSDGVDAFLGDAIEYFEKLQKMRAIKNFDSKEDIKVNIVDENSAYADVAVQVTKAFKKLYMNVRLK